MNNELNGLSGCVAVAPTDFQDLPKPRNVVPIHAFDETSVVGLAGQFNIIVPLHPAPKTQQ
jgi:hypothetical protein